MAVHWMGADVARAIDEKNAKQVDALKARGITPTLGLIRIGERGGDIAYESSLMRYCAARGIKVERFLMPADVTQAQMLELMDKINADDAIHGAMIFRPLPKHLDEMEICNTLAAHKDVDGVSESSLAGVFSGSGHGFAPCTSQACVQILDHFGINCAGKRAVVLGRSLVVGRPAAIMLLERNATVTICHSKTQDLPGVCREADILVVAIGRADFVDASFLAPGQVVVDAGINFDDHGKQLGDVDQADADGIVAAYTPVPGGVGVVTTAMLASHLIEAASRN